HARPAASSMSARHPTPAHPSLFLSLRPPPSHPLFPYTTLFRSTSNGATAMRFGSRVGLALAPQCATDTTRAPMAAVTAPATAAIDRKSTRLNSSHVSISYAVFCLKKKRYNSEPVLRYNLVGSRT